MVLDCRGNPSVQHVLKAPEKAYRFDIVREIGYPELFVDGWPSKKPQDIVTEVLRVLILFNY